MAAFLNLIFGGAGYLYLGRISEGVLFILAWFVPLVASFLDAAILAAQGYELPPRTPYTIFGFLSLLMPLALAYSAYREAKTINSSLVGEATTTSGT